MFFEKGRWFMAKVVNLLAGRMSIAEKRKRLEAEQRRNVSGENVAKVEAAVQAAGGQEALDEAERERKRKEEEKAKAKNKSQSKTTAGGGAFVGAQNVDKKLAQIKKGG